MSQSLVADATFRSVRPTTGLLLYLGGVVVRRTHTSGRPGQLDGWSSTPRVSREVANRRVLNDVMGPSLGHDEADRGFQNVLPQDIGESLRAGTGAIRAFAGAARRLRPTQKATVDTSAAIMIPHVRRSSISVLQEVEGRASEPTHFLHAWVFKLSLRPKRLVNLGDGPIEVLQCSEGFVIQLMRATVRVDRVY